MDQDVPLTNTNTKVVNWDKDTNTSADTEQMYGVNRLMLASQAAIPQHCAIDFSIFPVANNHFKSTHQSTFTSYASLN